MILLPVTVLHVPVCGRSFKGTACMSLRTIIEVFSLACAPYAHPRFPDVVMKKCSRHSA